MVHAEGHNIDLHEDPDAVAAAAPFRPALAFLAFDDTGMLQPPPACMKLFKGPDAGCGAGHDWAGQVA